MLFDIPFVAGWHKIGEQRQSLTDHGNKQENAKRIDYNYKVRDKVLLINEGILCKAESAYSKEPWTITTAHTTGTIRVQCGTKTERLSIWRVQPFTDDILQIRQNIYNMTISSINLSPTLTKSYASLIVTLSLHLS
jgi:hypothetical protein